MDENKRKTIEIERAQLEEIMQHAASAAAELLEFLDWADETLKKHGTTETDEGGTNGRKQTENNRD